MQTDPTDPTRTTARATCFWCAWPLVGGLCARCDRDVVAAAPAPDARRTVGADTPTVLA